MSSIHGDPPEVVAQNLIQGFRLISEILFEQGLECMVTFEDITKDNYCEYRTFPSQKWHPSKFASGVVRCKFE